MDLTRNKLTKAKKIINRKCSVKKCKNWSICYFKAKAYCLKHSPKFSNCQDTWKNKQVKGGAPNSKCPV